MSTKPRARPMEPEIRRRALAVAHDNPDVSIRTIAERFGVSHSVMKRLVREYGVRQPSTVRP